MTGATRGGWLCSVTITVNERSGLFEAGGCHAVVMVAWVVRGCGCEGVLRHGSRGGCERAAITGRGGSVLIRCGSGWVVIAVIGAGDGRGRV